MARAYGADATLCIMKESVYGIKPSGNWEKVSFISSDLSSEQGLIASDLLGQGREPQAPFRDVINDRGNMVIPAEARDFGRWLEFLLGSPTTAGVASTGDITFTTNPTAGHTITLNGVTWSFVASGATGNQTNIAGSLASTLTQLATDLNASSNMGLTPATYASSGGTKLTITYDTNGGAGNAYTLASNNTNAVPSGTSLSGGGYTHTFVSGASSLPSFACQVGHPKVPAYFVHTGAVLGSMAFNFERSGTAKVTGDMIAQGEAKYTTSQAGTPTTRSKKLFSQFNGSIKRNGTSLANATGASFSYSNGLEAVEVIRSDGLIDGVDPTQITITGSLDVRFADTLLLDDATNNSPIELELGYKMAGLDGNNFSLLWTFHEVYLPKPKLPLSGPGGVQASFNWQGAYDDVAEKSATVVLKNDVASYT